MEIYALKINGFDHPLGMRCDQVVLSWKVRGAKGTRPVSAVAEVSEHPDFADICCRVEDADSLCTMLPVKPKPRTRYDVRVTIVSDAGEQVEGVCWFETGKMDEPWQGQWIAPQDDSVHPEFVRILPVNGAIESARLYICGLGLFEAYLGQTKIGENHLAPFLNDYDAHVQACAYDITEALRQDQELHILLGKGWWMGRFGLTDHAFKDKHFALIAEVHVTYTDGRHEVIGTNDSWQYRPSAWTLTDIYDGETQDWQAYRTTLDDWKSARLIAAPAKLCDRYSLPLHTVERFPVKEVIHTPKGETVLDFGQNTAGIIDCAQAIPAGQTLTLEFGEVMQDGCFYHDNYRTAKSQFTYISDGEQRDIQAHFTFFGFRYVKVSGLDAVNPDLWKAEAISSDTERIGWWVSGHEKVNRLHENTWWGLRSNFVDIPTDCPQRDERLGWTGDAQAFCTTAGYLADTRAFYDKFMRDLRTDQQRNDGKVAIYLPNEFPGLIGAAWSDIGTFLPHMLYLYSGDKVQLARHYPMMRDWVDCVHRLDAARGEKNLWDFGFQFGDWVALDGATEQSRFGRTDSGFVASSYYCASTRYTAEAAAELGYTEDAKTYRALAERIKAAIESEYFTATGRLAVDTQTGYLLALRFGLGKDQNRLKQALRERIKKDLRHIKGGFVGATTMNTVLADHGMADLAYDFLLYEGFPGWLYAVNLGATTIWERWNSILPDGKISGTSMNSLNHYAYGSVTEFLYRHAAGIQPLTPGFRQVRLAPQPNPFLKYVNCRYDSAAGLWESAWRINADGSLTFRFTVPFGCTAEILLPEQDAMQVDAGQYEYTIRTKHDYRCLYTTDTPAETLLKNPEAVSAVEAILPGTLTGIDPQDEEALSKSLLDMRTQAALFRQPTESFDRAIKAICSVQGDFI